jgi:hypothetical protein
MAQSVSINLVSECWRAVVCCCNASDVHSVVARLTPACCPPHFHRQVFAIGEEVRETSDSGFLGTVATIHTQLLEDGSMLQVSNADENGVLCQHRRFPQQPTKTATIHPAPPGPRQRPPPHPPRPPHQRVARPRPPLHQPRHRQLPPGGDLAVRRRDHVL